MTSGLNEYAEVVTSQWGEDGIVAEIFLRLAPRHRYCVEFGAWDGKHLSNVWRLWHEQGWRGLLIEGDAERFKVLDAAVAEFADVRAVHRFVTPEGPDRLDALLAEAGAPEDLDLVSIDIDGDDYYVFESLEAHRPRCVIVEHNSTIPPKLDIVQERGEYFGCSARALLRLAHEKGYRLCACTRTNSIFVRESEFETLAIEEPALETAFPPDELTHVISSYDGALLVERVPIHQHKLKRARIVDLRRQKAKHPRLAGPDTAIPVVIEQPRRDPEA